MIKLQNTDIIHKMSLEEKISLCSGASFWGTEEMKQYGINSFYLNDGPHGLRKQREGGDHLGLSDSIPATCFPTASTTSSTWDIKLVESLGNALAYEACEQKVDVILGPGINIKRNPLCGRNFEYFSEDPYLSGEMGAAWIKGVESQGIAASPKHFAANNQEAERMLSDSIIDERALREIYLAPFEAVIKKASPSTLMCSYNKINGTYLSDHIEITRGILRDEWGFKGLVVTDWGAMNNRIEAFKASVDLEMPTSGKMFDKEVLEAVRNGALDETCVDEAVDRILTFARNRIGIRGNPNKFDREKHHSLAKQIAMEGAILMKNENQILPLNPTNKVTLIGSLADDFRYQGSGSSRIIPTKLVSIRDALELGGYDYRYCKGYESDGSANKDCLEEAIKAASGSEVVLAVIGLPESYESEGFDRTHMLIPESQIQLLAEISKVNTRVIAILLGGGPVQMQWEKYVKAVLNMYLPGQAGGEACIDLLFGKGNPCGKLAETYPLIYEDVPSAHIYGVNPRQAEYRESIYVGYRYYEKAGKEVAYPFGYGLSYTNYAYSDIKLTSKTIKIGDRITVSFNIANTGKMAGKEVIQCYISDKTSCVFRPVKELKAFAKVELQAGETKQVSMELKSEDFMYYDKILKDWTMGRGEYEILIGSSSSDIHLRDTLEVTGDARAENRWNIDNNEIRNSPIIEWYENPTGYPNKKSFEMLLGQEIIPYETPVKGKYTMNSTLKEMDANLLAKIIIKGIRKTIAKPYDLDETDPGFLFIYYITMNTPVQRLCQSSGDKRLLKLFKGMVFMANGHYLKGLKAFIENDR